MHRKAEERRERDLGEKTETGKRRGKEAITGAVNRCAGDAKPRGTRGLTRHPGLAAYRLHRRTFLRWTRGCTAPSSLSMFSSLPGPSTHAASFPRSTPPFWSSVPAVGTR